MGEFGAIAGAHIGQFGDFGYMWECPDLFTLDGQEVLVFSPQGIESDGIHYQNLYQAGYVIGELDYEHAKYNHGAFVEIDRGFEFYAPQTTVDEQGRRILIGWFGMPEEREDAHPTIEHKWVHAMTLPRELKLVDGKLYQQPIVELKELRKEEVSYPGVELKSNKQSFDKIEGETLELFMENLEKNEPISINIRNHANIVYSPKEQLLKVDRISFVDGQTVEERFCHIETLDNLRIYLDTSSLELFVNDGEEVFSVRIYPKITETGISFSSEGKAKVNLTAWKL